MKRTSLTKYIKAILFGWLTILGPQSLAQYTQQRLDKSQEINSSDYAKIKGSPYLYDEFMYASFFDREGVQHQSEFINYNGYEETFEVIRDSKLYNFKASPYDSIVIHPTKNDSLKVYESFVRGALPGSNTLNNVVYYGNQLKLIREFKVRIEVKTTETPGQTVKNERFAGTSFYKLIRNHEVSSIRLKKADFINQLGHKNELLSYAKKAKLSFSNPEELKKILRYYEEITNNQSN